MINIQKTEKIVKLYTEKLILASEPLFPLWNRENFLFSKPGKWNYIDGCMIKAAIMLYELCGDKRLLDYAVRFTDCYVNESGDIPSMNVNDFNLDNINGGKNLIWLYKKTGNERYRCAFERLYSKQLATQPRLSCKSFFHKAIYPYQIWLDGAYMALPFLAEYAALHKNAEIAQDVIHQIKNINSIMRDSKTGLYCHGYDETRSTCWADKETGLSKEFWLRAMGWYCAALADICEIANADFPELSSLCSETLIGITNSLSGYISDKGMLYQLPARQELQGNYPETSGTLLFSYASLKAYRLNICDKSALDDGIKTFSAVTEDYISFDNNGMPVLKNTCLIAGLGGRQNRDGSAQYYLSEPVVENEAKGIAPYLMAYTELMRIISKA